MARAIRSFTLDQEVSQQIDAARPRGERSQYVNTLLRRALSKETAPQVVALFALNQLVLASAFTLGLGVL